jgi:hypothetical protein
MPLSLTTAIAAHYRGEWGFTGTRKGATPVQLKRLRVLLAEGRPTQFHHGGAFGADSQAHAIWREECKGADSMCVVWPADERREAIFQLQQHVRINPIMPPLDRNREIVKRSVLLIACPHTEQEERRSGTWATIRVAFALYKPVLILWPSGRMSLCRDGQYERLADA